MDDRKYRQRGYRESEARRGSEIRRGPERPPPGPPGPRSPAMPGRRTVSRCAECGTLLPPLTEPTARCPKCGSALHACKQCTHFDPGRRFECTQPIPERIADKSAQNDCPFFSLRTMVERDTSFGSVRPEDARRAFENLFRKQP